MAELRIADRVELPPRPAPRKESGGRLPSRLLAALAVPAAGLSVAAALQRWIEGPKPAGDALVRWVIFGSIASLLFGVVAGVLLAKGRPARLAWAVWGAVAPALVTVATLAGAQMVFPLRERIAAVREQACREKGRATCTPVEFSRACRSASGVGADQRKLLGAPAQELCGPDGCTRRWVYDGPWRAIDVSHRPMICSVVTDAKGAPVRLALAVGETEP